MLTFALTIALVAAPAFDPEFGGCNGQLPAALPAPATDGRAQAAVIDIFEVQPFLIRSDAVRHFRLIESPVAPNAEAQQFQLEASASSFVVGGIRYNQFDAPSLPIGRCFQMHESAEADGGYFRSGIYQNALLCVTKRGAADNEGPQTPDVTVSAEKPYFGRPQYDNIEPAIARVDCGVAMQVGEGNITATISGISVAPSVLVVELLHDGDVVALREVLFHSAMRDTQEPVIVRMDYDRAISNLQIRVTHRTLDGETGTPVVQDVAIPGGCHSFPASTVWLLLAGAALRRRRRFA